MTQTGKQKPSHPLLPLPPCLAAAPCPQPTVGSLFWSSEPWRPCSLEAQTQAGQGGVGVPRPPCSVSHSGQDQPPHVSPRPSQEPGAVPAMEGTTSVPGSVSQGGLPRLVSGTKPCHGQGHTPGQWNHERQLETPRAARCPRRRTSHLALCTPVNFLVLLPLKRALAWKDT